MDFNLPASMPLLERTPRALTGLLGGLPAEWTHAAEGPGTWSATTIVAHLLHSDRTNWIPRARSIRERQPPQPLPPFDRNGQQHALERTAVAELLSEFEHERERNLVTLASWRLDDASLALEGLHPEFGRVTLAQLLAAWVAHDLAHLAQVGRVLAKQYRDAVGPWRAYLPILDR